MDLVHIARDQSSRVWRRALIHRLRRLRRRGWRRGRGRRRSNWRGLEFQAISRDVGRAASLGVPFVDALLVLLLYDGLHDAIGIKFGRVEGRGGGLHRFIDHRSLLVAHLGKVAAVVPRGALLSRFLRPTALLVGALCEALRRADDDSIRRLHRFLNRAFLAAVREVHGPLLPAEETEAEKERESKRVRRSATEEGCCHI